MSAATSLLSTGEVPVPAARATFEQRLLSCAPKQVEVLELMVKGFTSKQIGTLLHKSPDTVEQQRWFILRRMHCRNCVELTREYWCWKLTMALPEPMVLSRTFLHTTYYYLGYYGLPNPAYDPKLPAETQEPHLAAVFDSPAIAHRVLKGINECHAAAEWTVVPKNKPNE